MTQHPLKILVVDDSPIAQKLARKWLEQSKYTVVEAWDGKECLAKVKSHRPDVILMDVILPDADGKELVVEIKRDPANRQTAVIFTTNTVKLKDDKGYQAFELNRETYRAFAKPLHFPKVLSVIRKEVNRFKSAETLTPKLQKIKKQDA